MAPQDGPLSHLERRTIRGALPGTRSPRSAARNIYLEIKIN